MTLSKIRFILLDAVGTLIYPNPPAPVVYYNVGRRFGSNLSSDETADRFKRAFARQEHGDRLGGHCRRSTDEQRERGRWQHIVKDVFRDVVDAGDELFEELWEHFSQGRHWKLYDDVRDAWLRLKKMGYTLGIASNFDRRLLNICSAHVPLDQCPYIFWSAEIGYPKPSPLFFVEVQQRIGVESEEILLVGDTVANDYEGAKAAGWHAIWLSRDRAASANDSIRSLRQLPKLLAT